MKRAFGLVLTMMVFTAVPAVQTASASRPTLATITGSVRDNKGAPLAGALISLLKEGAGVVKHTRSGADGKFLARVAPGKYGIRAIADGFNEVVFSSVEVRASQELVYRFNLEPIGGGKTIPEQRRDRDDVKWTLRSAQSRRSIFQVQESDAEDIRAVLGSKEAPDETEQTVATEEVPAGIDVPNKIRPQGVIETYVSSDALAGSYSGLNFAVSVPTTHKVELIFAGQTGIGPGAPERLEATARFQPFENHRIDASLAGVRINQARWLGARDNSRENLGQVSVRAIDEWIVRDGIVIVLGVDYSRFVGAGGGHSVTPRFGIQVDANARTRFRAAYVPAGDESSMQSVATFEDNQVVFSDHGNRPIAYVDGQAVMERSHRLEFGVERVIDSRSNLEASAFLDTTSGRGVGL
jgi:hypothetical protein